jgi:MoaA/NifB/PqqE/SkfB family radical SAM enzyme
MKNHLWHWRKPLSLLGAQQTKTVHIEFTSRCNLRCVFCCASQPYYRGQDLPAALIENLIASLVQRRVELVCVSGHGETTIFPEWGRICEKMLTAGLKLHIISNFAKPLTMAEAETLARFQSIEVSCDTADPELFSKLRRGGQLSTLIANLEKVRRTGQEKFGGIPKFSFSCVISDQNVFKLDEYVEFATANGIRHFDFCNLTKYADIPDALNPQHVSELPPAEARAALVALEHLIDNLKRKEANFFMHSGLLDSLRSRIQDNTKHLEAVGIGKKSGENQPVKTEMTSTQPHKYSSRVSSPRQTRDCLDPWNFFLLNSRREVWPCCWHKPIFHLSDHQNLDEALNSLKIMELRRNLLHGTLDPDCQVCPSRGLIPVGQLRSKVKKNLYKSSFLQRFSEALPRFKPVPFERTDGWFPEESAPAPDKTLDHWRWIGHRAAISFFPPKQGLRLILQAAVVEANATGQVLTIRLNGRVVDTFEPPSRLFIKEYFLSPADLDVEKKAEWSVTVEKTFCQAMLDPTSNDNRELGLQIFSLELLAVLR